MAVNLSEMVAILSSQLGTVGAIVEKVSQKHGDIALDFSNESSEADTNNADAADASNATAGAKEVLAADTETRDEQQEITDEATQNAEDRTSEYNDTLDPLSSAIGALSAAYQFFFSLLNGDDADAINAASAKISARQGEVEQAQQATDAAEAAMNEAVGVKETEEGNLDKDNATVDGDQTAVDGCEADEAEVADETSTITSAVEETGFDAQNALQEVASADYYDYSDVTTGTDDSGSAGEAPSMVFDTKEEVDPATKALNEQKNAETKIQNNEITDEKMAEVITKDIFAGDIANTSIDELVGLNAQDAIEKVNKNLKAQSLYAKNVSTTMDTASIEENQEAISDFFAAYLNIQDKLSQSGVEFVSTTDEVNYATLSGVSDKLIASEYVMTSEIKKATSTADSIQVTTSDVTEVENKEAEIEGDMLLRELESVITDDADAKEDENDDVLTQKEYDNEKNFFENAENKANAYEKLAKDAEKYEIFALAE